jgi:hypothetical protein
MIRWGSRNNASRRSAGSASAIGGNTGNPTCGFFPTAGDRGSPNAIEVQIQAAIPTTIEVRRMSDSLEKGDF